MNSFSIVGRFEGLVETFEAEFSISRFRSNRVRQNVIDTRLTRQIEAQTKYRHKIEVIDKLSKLDHMSVVVAIRSL